jgi:hypothetical protein
MLNAERFAKYVDKSGCWLWQGAISQNRGYGLFQWWDGTRTKTRLAHRCSYELANGPIPEGMFVLHTCDVRACVNPDHLYLGTQKRNMQDMIERGRAATGDRNGKRVHPDRIATGSEHWTHKHPDALASGEANGNAKYTAELVAEVRKRREAGALLREVSVEFGIPIGTVHQICSGKTWR